MTVVLRDRLFTDTGLPVQGATVQAVLVTGGGTDSGTSSLVQDTTTTDVNGVWKFTTLPDAGAGNWYDVKIINGNQIRWRYGNINSVISQLQLGAVLANLHLTTPVVDSGGLTVTAGNLTVTAGKTQIGATTAIAQEQISGAGATSWAGYASSGTNNPGTLTTPGGVLMLVDSGVSAGDGGVALFGTGGSSWYAGIKGFLTNGSNNGIGDLAFATRNAGTDTALTERLRIKADGTVNALAPLTVNTNAGTLPGSGDIRLTAERVITWLNHGGGGTNTISFNTSNDLTVTGSGTSASASAGGSALPAAPAGFITISYNGGSQKIPYYNP